MEEKLKVAACQFPVSSDIGRNAGSILRFMRAAALESADVVLFPEAALCGYAGVDRPSVEGIDWGILNRETDAIRRLAEELQLWVILGSCYERDDGSPPTNCLFAIAEDGEIRARYDKRMLYGKEVSRFSPGAAGTALNIRGYWIGLLICYDSCFPELYESYRTQGVSILFHAYHNARSRATGAGAIDHLILAQIRTRAADHRMWIVASNSSQRYSRLAACIARPDGSVVSTRRHVPGVVYHSFPDAEMTEYLRREAELIANARAAAELYDGGVC